MGYLSLRLLWHNHQRFLCKTPLPCTLGRCLQEIRDKCGVFLGRKQSVCTTGRQGLASVTGVKIPVKNLLGSSHEVNAWVQQILFSVSKNSFPHSAWNYAGNILVFRYAAKCRGHSITGTDIAYCEGCLPCASPTAQGNGSRIRPLPPSARKFMSSSVSLQRQARRTFSSAESHCYSNTKLFHNTQYTFSDVFMYAVPECPVRVFWYLTVTSAFSPSFVFCLLRRLCNSTSKLHGDDKNQTFFLSNLCWLPSAQSRWLV